jgi:hypothetical protein
VFRGVIAHEMTTLDLCTEFPEPVPLEVYHDATNPERSIKTFIAFSGFIGDLIQQTLCASCTSHTGEKGCMRCFCMGTNTLQDGTYLGTNRMLGMHHPIAAEVFQVPGEGVGEVPLTLMDSLIFTTEVDGKTVYLKPAAETVAISHNQHMIRVRTAELACAEAMEQHPVPPVLPAHRAKSEHDTRRKGAAPPHK